MHGEASSSQLRYKIKLTFALRDANTNFTIKIYPSDAEDKCKGGDDGGLILTTDTIPRALTCIALENMWVGDNDSGFLPDNSSHTVIYNPRVDQSKLPPPGIHWTIPSSSAEYDASQNYSSIWFEQRNATDQGESEEGEDGRWVVTTYANPSCDRIKVEETPWYETSCQTSEDGQCESVPYNIKSIGIRPYFPYEFNDCQTWAKVGAASGLVPRVSVALAVTTVAFLLL